MRLLAIVEIPKDQRVYCQAEHCARTVYRRVHIVEDDGDILVLGSKCYSVLYEDDFRSHSEYTGWSSRALSLAERELLIRNTRALIEKFEAEKQTQQRKRVVQNTVVSETAERQVRCSYCLKPMLTALKRRPGRGYRCPNCKASGLTDFELRSRFS